MRCTGYGDYWDRKNKTPEIPIVILPPAPDLTPPTVASAIPLSGATNVAVSTVIEVVFSEPMAVATVDGTSFYLVQGTNCAASKISGTITASNSDKTFSFPSGTLNYSTQYSVCVDVTVKDVALNSLSTSFLQSFTTAAAADVTPPAVMSFFPAASAAGISTAITATVTFDEAMDVSTVNTSFSVRTTNCSGAVVSVGIPTPSNGNKTFEYALTGLTNSTTYVSCVTTGAKDLAGNSLPAPANAAWDTVALPPSSYIADTGQTLCYNDTASAGCATTASTHPRQDADFVDTPRARSFTGPTQHVTYATDYTTTDNVSGLIWKTCSEGLSGATCATGTIGTYTLSPDTATPQCTGLNLVNAGAGYAGRTDWRLPTIIELATIVDYAQTITLVDLGLFPGTQTAQYYWTSTPDAATAGQFWALRFNAAMTPSYSKLANTNSYYVRCVSGTFLATPAFVDNGIDNTVTDTTNNLVWQKCTVGKNADSTCTGTSTFTVWKDALTACKNLTLASRTDWRLPSVNELMTLIDYTKSGPPVINATLFPATGNLSYWTSTTYSVTTTRPWNVSFSNALTGNSTLKTSASFYARCVATGP